MAGLTQKILASGLLPSATDDLYLCPGNTDTRITSIRLVNVDTSARAVNIFVLPYGGTARHIIGVDISIPAKGFGIDEATFTLSAGDKVQGDADTADKVSYVISGLEKV